VILVVAGAFILSAYGLRTKDILFLLFTFEKNNVLTPILGMDLMGALNKSRNSNLYDTNFRCSCHTLFENDLVKRYRNKSLKLAWLLTEKGRNLASTIFDDRLNELKAEKTDKEP